MQVTIRSASKFDRAGKPYTVDETTTVQDLLDNYAEDHKIRDKRWFGLCVQTHDAGACAAPLVRSLARADHC